MFLNTLLLQHRFKQFQTDIARSLMSQGSGAEFCGLFTVHLSVFVSSLAYQAFCSETSLLSFLECDVSHQCNIVILITYAFVQKHCFGMLFWDM
uniref:Uncharacterized protein n=1 Tax=Rhipicephalus appendiculatus TaxID=34631 RepID=A0A131YCF5_RHIAP